MEQTEVQIEEIIQECLNGNSSAQFVLYEQYSKAMFNVAMRMLGNKVDAEDALQDAFVNAFKHLKRFEGRVTFGVWMRKITINTCLNCIRKKKLKWLELDFEVPDTENEEGFDIDPKVLSDAIEKLPSGCRTVFVLKAFEGYKHEAISEQLKISLSTSKSQYIRAKKLLTLSLKKMVKL